MENEDFKTWKLEQDARAWALLITSLRYKEETIEALLTKDDLFDELSKAKNYIEQGQLTGHAPETQAVRKRKCSGSRFSLYKMNYPYGKTEYS